MIPQTDRANARQALFASIFLTAAAFYGMASGAADWSGDFAIQGSNEVLDVPGARRALERIEQYPKRAAIGALNVVVSFLLLAGSLMITIRRPTAVWLVRQAIAANLIFIVLRAGVRLSHVWSLGDAIIPLADAVIRASGEAPPSGPDAPDALSLARAMNAVGEFTRAVFIGVIHVYIGYRATRPGVRRFVREPGAEEPDAS